MEADSKKLTYSCKDFHFSISNKHGQPNKSEFDVQFLRMWNMAVSAEVFRYSVDGVETKVLPGKYNLVTQVCFPPFSFSLVSYGKYEYIQDVSL